MPSPSTQDLKAWLDTMRARFDAMLDSLRARFLEPHFEVLSAPVGAEGLYQGHYVALDASFTAGDCISLAVTAAYLTSKPQVSADVTAGGDSTGAKLASTREHTGSDAPMPDATAEALAHIDAELPRLVDVFYSALEQRTNQTRRRS